MVSVFRVGFEFEKLRAEGVGLGFEARLNAYD